MKKLCPFQTILLTFIFFLIPTAGYAQGTIGLNGNCPNGFTGNDCMPRYVCVDAVNSDQDNNEETAGAPEDWKCKAGLGVRCDQASDCSNHYTGNTYHSEKQFNTLNNIVCDGEGSTRECVPKLEYRTIGTYCKSDDHCDTASLNFLLVCNRDYNICIGAEEGVDCSDAVPNKHPDLVIPNSFINISKQYRCEKPLTCQLDQNGRGACKGESFKTDGTDGTKKCNKNEDCYDGYACADTNYDSVPDMCVRRVNYGTNGLNEACTFVADCLPGYRCVDTDTPSDGVIDTCKATLGSRCNENKDCLDYNFNTDATNEIVCDGTGEKRQCVPKLELRTIGTYCASAKHCDTASVNFFDLSCDQDNRICVGAGSGRDCSDGVLNTNPNLVLPPSFVNVSQQYRCDDNLVCALEDDGTGECKLDMGTSTIHRNEIPNNNPKEEKYMKWLLLGSCIISSGLLFIIVRSLLKKKAPQNNERLE